MLTLRIENARKEWNGSVLFQNINFELVQGEKVALFGQNGIGKTSLLRAIMGAISLDDGNIHYGVPPTEWGWLEQDLQVPNGVSLLDFVKSGDAELGQLWANLERLMGEMEHPNRTEVEHLMTQYADALEQYEAGGGYAWETQIEMALTRFNLPKSVWETPYQALSGGQKTRAQLARLTVRKPRALILDEPTNHLDVQMLRDLALWLNGYDGTVLFVTHDRAFMDQVADALIELTPGACRRYSGGYAAFKAARDLEIRAQTALYEKQERERRDLINAVQRYRQWYQKGHDAAGERNPFLKKRAMKNATRFKAKERALERLEARQVERPQDVGKARVEFVDPSFSARSLARFENISVSFDHQEVLQDVSLTVRRGDRIAVMGPNGAGKSTLLKTLTGEIVPAAGAVRRHPALHVGYFDQELRRQNLGATVLDTLLSLPDMDPSLARTILAGFLFRREDVFKPLSTLSMGERCRVAFVQLYLSGANLLVLDEPTNYLDVETRERVEEALLDYPGALVLVTHDVYLLRKVANRIVKLGDGCVEVFEGSFDAYQDSLTESSVRNLETDNRIRQLQLTLTQLVGDEEPGTAAERAALSKRIHDTQAELRRLSHPET